MSACTYLTNDGDILWPCLGFETAIEYDLVLRAVGGGAEARCQQGSGHKSHDGYNYMIVNNISHR